MSDRTLIIAEAGVNHNGDIELAKQLVEVAAEAGADYVKFQTFSADRIVTRSANKAEYQQRTTSTSETQYEMLKKLELSVEMHLELIRHCEQRSIRFLSTGFDVESIDLLVGLGQQLIKIPSGEITNLPLLRHVGSLRLPIVMSSGMSTMDEIGDAIAILEQGGLTRDRITILHCTTEYPTPMNEVNLRAMTSIQETYQVAVGYSDHTIGIEVSVAAVALGACVIEKHFTIDRSLAGPDHKASLEPFELVAMVKAIRNIEISLGSEIKAPSISESKNIRAARKSIVAKTHIKSGDILHENNLTTKRSGGGISAMHWDDVIGTISNYEYDPDDEIKSNQ